MYCTGLQPWILEDEKLQKGEAHLLLFESVRRDHGYIHDTITRNFANIRIHPSKIRNGGSDMSFAVWIKLFF